MEPEYLNWLRFRNGNFTDLWLDACRLLLLVDLRGWPAADAAHPRSEFTAPSIDVSCEFHNFDSATDWLLLEGASPHAAAGPVSSRQRVWGADGPSTVARTLHGTSHIATVRVFGFRTPPVEPVIAVDSPGDLTGPGAASCRSTTC